MDARTAREDSRRAQRGATALVAQYIHELSDRHGRQRRVARPRFAPAPAPLRRLRPCEGG
jgi:hypothetical protein